MHLCVLVFSKFPVAGHLRDFKIETGSINDFLLISQFFSKLNIFKGLKMNSSFCSTEKDCVFSPVYSIIQWNKF